MTASTRPKIWEIGEFQCPILGTCLSIAELRKLGRKARLAAAVNLSDFELYTVFVRKCQEKDSISIMVNKFLDRKYAKVIKNLVRLKTPEDLRAAWQAAVADGDIPGAFWEIMSHPEADKGLIHLIYGEVHMLSHLVGASNRADIRRLAQLEKLATRLQESLSRGRAAWLEHRRAAASELREAQSNLNVAWRTIRKQQTELHTLDEVRRMGGAIKLLAEVSLLREKDRHTDAMIRQQATALEQLQAENDALHRGLSERDRALQILDQLLEGGISQPGDHVGACTTPVRHGFRRAVPLTNCAESRNAEVTCPGQTDSRLCGKCVLYVGGRNNLTPHYRKVVESLGCRFRHHDGGTECRLAMLEAELGKADVVICPVDCVSHEACQRVKRFCKSAAKPFVMLRSSGVSALSRSIQKLEIEGHEVACQT